MAETRRLREGDSEGYVPKRGMNWKTIFSSVFGTVFTVFIIWAVSTYVQKEKIETDFTIRLVNAEEQTKKVPVIENANTGMVMDIAYLKEGQEEQSKDMDELKQDMKTGLSEIKLLIQSKP